MGRGNRGRRRDRRERAPAEGGCRVTERAVLRRRQRPASVQEAALVGELAEQGAALVLGIGQAAQGIRGGAHLSKPDACTEAHRAHLPLPPQGSNLDFPESESGVLPITPGGTNPNFQIERETGFEPATLSLGS